MSNEQLKTGLSKKAQKNLADLEKRVMNASNSLDLVAALSDMFEMCMAEKDQWYNRVNRAYKQGDKYIDDIKKHAAAHITSIERLEKQIRSYISKFHAQAEIEWKARINSHKEIPKIFWPGPWNNWKNFDQI